MVPSKNSEKEIHEIVIFTPWIAQHYRLIVQIKRNF